MDVRAVVQMWLVCLVVCVWFGAGASEVQAQQTTAFQAQQFRPWADPEGMFQTHSARTLGQWKYKLGAYFNYAKDPLIFRDEQGNRISDPNVLAQIKRADLLGHQLGMDIVGGIGFMDWFDLAVAIPVTLYQSGGFPTIPSVFGTNSGRDTSGAFFSDIKVALKFQALKEEKHFVSLGFHLYLGIPTGNKDNFNGEDTVSFGAKVLLSRKISIVHLALNLGYRFLPRTEFLTLEISHQLTYSLAAAVTVLPKRLDLIADLAGATGVTGTVGPEAVPFELLLGARIYPWKYTDLAINVGGGLSLTPGYGSPQVRFFAGLTWAPKEHDRDKDGVMDNVDKCPTVPGPKENNGCPWPDTDGDGLKDNVDKCPKVAGPKENKGCPWPDTDKDGLTDNIDKCPKVAGPKENNGCPWPDTDKDGLHDKIDKCPTKPGPKKFEGCPDTDKDGIPDHKDKCPLKPGPKEFEGCPDTDKDGLPDHKDKCPTEWGPKENKGCPVAVIETRNKRLLIAIKDKIFFQTGKDKILSRSFYIIDNVIRILRRYPKLRVMIEGHTDNIGSARYNRRLSYRRARAVRNYINEKGVPRRRLRFRGYGYRRPIATNRTNDGRAKNRRVEFLVLNRRALNPNKPAARKRRRRSRRRRTRKRSRKRSRKRRTRKRAPKRRSRKRPVKRR